MAPHLTTQFMHCSAKGVRLAQRRCKLAHACLWEYSKKRLELAQLLGQGWRLSHLHVAALLEVAADLGVDVKVILTPPCIFCMENH